MSSQPAEASESQGRALALPDTAVVQWLTDLAENTRQWGEYAQQKLLEGDPAEASKALATMNTQIEELQRHGQVTMVVVGGLVETVKTVITQRDDLVREVEELKDTVEWVEKQAFSEGMAMAEESVMEEIWDDPSIVSEVVDQAREQDLQYLIGQLRRVGNEGAAQLLESRYAQARQNREELERIENDARAWYFQLPIEARIGLADDGVEETEDDDLAEDEE